MTEIERQKLVVEDLLVDYERALNAFAEFMQDWRERHGRSLSPAEAAE